MVVYYSYTGSKWNNWVLAGALKNYEQKKITQLDLAKYLNISNRKF